MAIFLFLGNSVHLIPGESQDKYRTSLEKEIYNCLKNKIYSKMDVGIKIVTTDGTGTLFQLQPDKYLIPASVTKIITSGICLNKFGIAFNFETLVLTDGQIESGILNGNLFIKGKGDPGLMVTHLEEAAMELKKQGIGQIRGDLVYDNTFLDEEQPLYPPNARHLYSPPGALTVEYNWIHLGLDTGPPAKLWTIPQTGYARLVYNVKISDSDLPGKPSMIYAKMPWGDQYTVKGFITCWDRRYKVLRMCVTRPGLFTATLFKECLERSGIRVDGSIRKGRISAAAQIIRIIKTENLKDIIRSMNLESNNVIAELINKDLGAYFDSIPGTREKGLNIIRTYCQEKIGLRDFSIFDSSGLSQKNKFSATQLTRALNHFYDQLGRDFLDTLAPQGYHPHALVPVPPPGIKMFVKSGTLPYSGVNTVAGYIIVDENTEVFSFAILVNRREYGPLSYSGTFTIPLLTALMRAFQQDLKK